MRRHWLRGVKFALIGVLAVAVFGTVVMLLWNWLLPSVFGLPQIGFWQALGLFLLSRIMLGGVGGGHGPHGRMRKHMMERWERMSPEERERFMAGMRSRCGDKGPSGSESPA